MKDPSFISLIITFPPVFLPKLIQQAMKADTDAAIEAFGKNEQVRKVFWILFVAMAVWGAVKVSGGFEHLPKVAEYESDYS